MRSPLSALIHLPLQCTELSVTDIPLSSNTSAAMTATDTARSQHDDALLHERPANSVHEPSGGPSTSNASSQPVLSSDSTHLSQDSRTAASRTAHVSSGIPSASQQGTSTSGNSPSAAKTNAGSSRDASALVSPSSNGHSEPQLDMSKTSISHEERGSNSTRDSESSSSNVASSHIDWDKDSTGSHGVAVTDIPSATDHPVSKLTAVELQPKPYFVLSVKMKNGKVSKWLTP